MHSSGNGDHRNGRTVLPLPAAIEPPASIEAASPRKRLGDEARGELHAAQEVILSLERGEISLTLAARHLRSHLERARRLIGGMA
jgi:hypothetical protein